MTTYKTGPDNLAVLVLRGPSANTEGRTTGEIRQGGKYVQVVCEKRVAWVHRDDLQIQGVIERPAPLLAVVGVRERLAEKLERAA